MQQTSDACCLNPMPFVQRVPLTRDCLEGGFSLSNNLQTFETPLDSGIPTLTKQTFCNSRGFASFSKTYQGIWSKRQQFLFTFEFVSEPPHRSSQICPLNPLRIRV